MSRRRRKPVPLWKYRLTWTYMILSLVLAALFLAKGFELLKEAQGIPFEKDGQHCTAHWNTAYCCKGNRIYLSDTNLTSGHQVNYTLSPDCYRIEINNTG